MVCGGGGFLFYYTFLTPQFRISCNLETILETMISAHIIFLNFVTFRNMPYTTFRFLKVTPMQKIMFSATTVLENLNFTAFFSPFAPFYIFFQNSVASIYFFKRNNNVKYLVLANLNET